MAIEHIQDTMLWKKSLAARDDDAHSKFRDRLRSALLTMRENVIPFVRGIHTDVLGLTVHEESHLDALWQTAECIAGEDFELTPVEAFVFGASVLLHDTGLAVAAYPGGIAELRETSVWRDAEAWTRGHRTPPSDDALSDDERRTILFATLRKLHAEQAEKLVSFTFKRPGREEAIPLLQDINLHDALGTAIGRIAHSHHWNSGDLSSKLVLQAGTVPGFPPEWTLNELKVACLLRCADAAHIDALRAPTMLFAISNIEGVSADHWRFQNKLNAVTRAKGKLVYYAGQSFRIEEASSWWLAYDTMKMVDSEIQSCNAILEETGVQQFASTGVHGIESPRLLSKTVGVEGWAPVSAEVKVSDPVNLARTLGGRSLYGFGAIAPIRELLQNAVDAVHARRAHQERESDWGKIRLSIEQADNDSSDVWIHVDDNGTGMSERVVTGPLIDFGKSFWSSSLMDEEFPGLRSSSPKIVGKFGIGFFSVFLLGDAVRVITRRFDASDSSTLVLHFDELTRRPLLRRAATGELPLDYTTRVSVKLSDDALRQISAKPMGRYRDEHPVSLVSQLKHLIASVDVDVEIIDRVHDESHKHDGQWLTGSPEAFLREVCALKNGREIEQIVKSQAERVRLITEDDGTVVGRAALLLSATRDDNVCIVSVGGFSSRKILNDQERFQVEASGAHLLSRSPIVGVVIGDTNEASRARASALVSNEAIARWAQEQEKLIDVEQLIPTQCVSICHSLLKLGAETTKLPFGFLGGKFATVNEFKKAISESSIIDVPLSYSDYKYSFDFKNINNLHTPYFIQPLHPTVAIVMLGGSREILSEDDRRKIVQGHIQNLDEQQSRNVLNNYPLQLLRELASDVWKAEIIYSIRRVDLLAESATSGSLASWALRLSKAA